MLASIVSSEDEADGIEYRIFLLNKNDYKINDTWNATGLCGTGSNDVKVADAFVAEQMTIAVSDLTGGPTPGSAVNPNALYALPVFSLFPYVLSGVGLGNAQACLNDYVEFARHRASTYNRAKVSDMQTTQDQDSGGLRQDRCRAADYALELHRCDGRRAAWPHSGYRGQDETAA